MLKFSFGEGREGGEGSGGSMSLEHRVFSFFFVYFYCLVD